MKAVTAMKTLVVALAAAAALAALPAAADAHPLGNFTVNRYSLIEPGRDAVAVTYVLDMAEIPTFQALGGRPTPAAAKRYVRAHASGWARALELDVDGRRVALTLAPGGVRAELGRGQGGLATLRATLALRATVGPGAHRARYADRAFGDRVGWREIVVRPGDGVVVERSTAATRDVSRMLRRYPSGLLDSPLDVRSAELAWRAGTGASATVRAAAAGGTDAGTWGSGFTSLIERDRLTPGFVLLAIAVAMLWGALHALTPGHGKSIVAAYLVGSRGTSRHAVFLGATVTITHTAGVIALGLVTLYLSGYVVPETLFPWLSLVSAGIVLALGTAILAGRLRRLRAAPGGHGHHHHDHAGAHAHGHAHHHDGDGAHDHHHHDHDHDHGHGHSHVPPGADGSRVTVRSLLALGISGGIVPCPSALVVMLGAIALHRVAFGLVLVVAFSLGLAGTLTAIGLAVVHARSRLERLPVGPRAARLAAAIPAASAAVILVLGVLLTARALASFPGVAGALPGALVAVAAGAAAFAAALALARRPRRVRPAEGAPGP
jgi:nickel/cobalt transporter (NicO) family protein